MVVSVRSVLGVNKTKNRFFYTIIFI